MTKHVIANENETIWVCKDKGGYSLTTNASRAHIFDSKIEAKKVFTNNLSKLIKSKGVVVKAIALQPTGAEPQPQPKKEEHKVTYELESSKHIISILSDAVAKLNCRHFELVEKESKCDRRKTDVEHFIEFNAGKLNACDGYKAYKLLQDILLERRQIKDEIQLINMVRDRMAAEEIANIEKKVEELESRTYEPRELAYLFETKKKDGVK